MRFLKNILIFSGFFTIFLNPVCAKTSDYAKEGRWASQVEDGLMDGEMVWLKSGKHRFYAIFTESENESKKAVIVVHGIGVHPDWSGVIQPLRVGLTKSGFNTLSIQMPVLANGVEGSKYKPLFVDASNRISAAVQYLQNQGMQVDVLLAHSLGSVMSAYHLANVVHNFKQFVAIGMGGAGVDFLSKIDIKTLDLYGDEDIDSVLNSAKDRANASKNNKNYQQKQIKGDHFFNDNNELLIKTVRDFIVDNY